MGKSSLSPQSRKVLYGIIGIALFIGAVLIIAAVGQQLTTIMSGANATQTAQIDPEETALMTDVDEPTVFPITNPTIQSHASPTSARPSPTRQPEFNFPTEIAQIDSPENVTILEVSEATNVQVIDQSGAVIGTGLLRVYYASNVSPQNTTRVELELRFVEKFITATPFSDVTRIPVTAVTSTPQPMRPTATPRVSQYEESGVQVQQLMGASLFCLPESFSGCDESADPTAYAFIQEGGAFWSWTLRPQTSVGVHDLRLELWTLLSVNGQTRPNTVWQYPFSIT
ncbi:MAG: hypothetical protein SFZ02_18125, partial [bacterium]|nr:hypothetical protein [bacterium]